MSDDMFSETLGNLSDTRARKDCDTRQECDTREDCDTEEKQADEGENENDKVEIVDITEEILRPGLSFKTKESAQKSLKKFFAKNFHPCICVSKF